jgi:hypothetical protein
MHRRLRLLGIIAFATASAVVLFFCDPTRLGIFPRCKLHQWTGLWCPGCGSTRALHQLLHGNVDVAFRCNALAILLLPLAGYFAIQVSLGRQPAMKPVFIWTLVGIIAVFSVLRNIPAYPFNLLAP